jgi:hypothetical protein
MWPPFPNHTDVLALDEDIGHGALPGHASKFSLWMADVTWSVRNAERDKKPETQAFKNIGMTLSLAPALPE